jgi:hypothetical protein
MTSVLRYSRSLGLVPQGIQGIKWLVPVVFKLITLLRPRYEPQNVIRTTSFESALGLSPLFVREIRPMITLFNLGDQLQHVSHRILA